MKDTAEIKSAIHTDDPSPTFPAQKSSAVVSVNLALSPPHTPQPSWRIHGEIEKKQDVLFQ